MKVENKEGMGRTLDSTKTTRPLLGEALALRAAGDEQARPLALATVLSGDGVREDAPTCTSIP